MHCYLRAWLFVVSDSFLHPRMGIPLERRHFYLQFLVLILCSQKLGIESSLRVAFVHIWGRHIRCHTSWVCQRTQNSFQSRTIQVEELLACKALAIVRQHSGWCLGVNGPLSMCWPNRINSTTEHKERHHLVQIQFVERSPPVILCRRHWRCVWKVNNRICIELSKLRCMRCIIGKCSHELLDGNV